MSSCTYIHIYCIPNVCTRSYNLYGKCAIKGKVCDSRSLPQFSFLSWLYFRNIVFCHFSCCCLVLPSQLGRTYIHTYVRTYVCMYVCSVFMETQISICVCLESQIFPAWIVYVRACVHACVCVVHSCLHICAFMRAHVCVCVGIYGLWIELYGLCAYEVVPLLGLCPALVCGSIECLASCTHATPQMDVMCHSWQKVCVSCTNR